MKIGLLLLLNTKYALFILNMMARVYERMTLHFFIIFQQNHTLQNLDLARDMFKKREKAHQRIYFWMSLLQIVPLYAAIFIPEDFQLLSILVLTTWYLITQLVLVTGHYFTTEVSLMYDMRRLHKFEYKKHAKRMSVVFFATTLSLVLVLLFEISLFYSYVCDRDLVLHNPDYAAMFELFDTNESICKVFARY